MKLEAMGVNTNADHQEKELFLNPSRLEDIQREKLEKDAEKRRRLLDEQVVVQKTQRMFENEERSNLKDVPPAKYRIKDYKRKTFGKMLTARQEQDRP